MGSRKLAILVIVVFAALVVAAAFVWPSRGSRANKIDSLLVHAGAGIQPPLDELGKLFEEKTGIRVVYRYKGSGCLLPDIVVSSQGDLYIPGELYYVDQAKERGLIAEHRMVAQMSTVLIVQKGNPKGIQGLRDLTQPGLRLGLGDPEAIAVGRAAKETLTRAGVWEEVQGNVVMSPLNVVELGNAVKLAHLDGAIVWNATAALYPDAMETLEISPEWRVDSPIPVGVLTCSRDPEAAREYMNFVASGEAREIFLKHGYGMPSAEASAVPREERGG